MLSVLIASITFSIFIVKSATFQLHRHYDLRLHYITRSTLDSVPKDKLVDTKPSMNILTKGPPQQLFVPFVKWFWNFIWKLMVGELSPHDQDGRFIRDYSKSSFVSASISELSSLSSYHLYLGNPCPWCHRIYVALALFNSPISVTRLVDNAEKASKGGWIIDQLKSPDPLNQVDLAGVYKLCTNGEYSGRCTAPLLIDLTTNSIVSNESNEILKLLNNYKQNKVDINLRPSTLVDEIDKANQFYYNTLQNGVYRSKSTGI